MEGRRTNAPSLCIIIIIVLTIFSMGSERATEPARRGTMRARGTLAVLVSFFLGMTLDDGTTLFLVITLDKTV